jgi:hypothetical protein
VVSSFEDIPLFKSTLDHQPLEEIVWSHYLSLKTLRSFIPTNIRLIKLNKASFKRFLQQHRRLVKQVGGRYFVKINPTFEIALSPHYREGRPRKVVDKDINILILRLRLGDKLKDIAKDLEIHRTTLWRKIKSNNFLLEAYQEGKN